MFWRSFAGTMAVVTISIATWAINTHSTVQLLRLQIQDKPPRWLIERIETIDKRCAREHKSLTIEDRRQQTMIDRLEKMHPDLGPLQPYSMAPEEDESQWGEIPSKPSPPT